MIFVKLGGSLITDKTSVEAVRKDVLHRLASEIASVWRRADDGPIVLGHGSGSFGHVVAARYRTRSGVGDAQQWFGFVAVADAAARLNRFVVAALLEQGVPALSLAPSALVRVDADGSGRAHCDPVLRAVESGLFPVLYGDVAFDDSRGGTIVSTEEVFSLLVDELAPTRLLLAGEVPGVLDDSGAVVPHIAPATFPRIAPHLGGSRGTDVTGGMASKVEAMLKLVGRSPGLSVRVFSGLEPGLLGAAILNRADAGTLISAQ